MSRQTRALALMCAAVGAVLAATAARADSITQTATLPPTTTNFDGSPTAQLNIPLFNPVTYSTPTESAVLDSVTVDFKANIQNQYTMTFINPATITDSAQTVAAGGKGPTITLFQPDKVTPLLTAQEPNTPADLTRTETYGFTSGATFPRTFSSALPTTSPYYIAPSSATATQNQTLTSAADLALFTKSSNGPASLSLPVVATANSSILISSGNGAGGVSTLGDASATVTYTYHLTAPAAQTGQGPTPPVLTPEPATVILWGVGGVALMTSRHLRRRA